MTQPKRPAGLIRRDKMKYFFEYKHWACKGYEDAANGITKNPGKTEIEREVWAEGRAEYLREKAA